MLRGVGQSCLEQSKHCVIVNDLRWYTKFLISVSDIAIADFIASFLHYGLGLQFVAITSSGNALQALKVVPCVRRVYIYLSLIRKDDQLIVEVSKGPESSVKPKEPM